MESQGNVNKEEGLRLLKSGQIDEAIEVLENAKSADPDDSQIHTYLGAAYAKKSDKLHAIYEFEEAVRIDESPRAYYNLGLVYEQAHRMDEAIRQYQMAVDLDPNYAPASESIKRLHDMFAAQRMNSQQQHSESASA